MKCTFLRLTIIVLLFLLFFPYLTSAETKTFIKEYTYQASEYDSKVSCRALALDQVKRLLLEELGTYLESNTEVKNFHLTKDEIVIITAGIVSTEIIDERWDGKTYSLKAKIATDPLEVYKSIDNLRQDRQKNKDLEETRKKADEALREVERLKKELKIAKAGKTEQYQYNEAVDRLSATDWYEKGYALWTAKRYEEAIEAFTKAVKLDPKYALAYYLRGAVYYLHGRLTSSFLAYRQAIQDYDRAIELDPSYAAAFSGRGLAYDGLKEYRQAIKDFNRAIEMDPKDAMTYFARGIASDNLGDKRRAIMDYNKTIELNLKDASVYSYRGIAYGKLKEYRKAINDLDRAIELDPKDAEAYSNRALAYSELNDGTQAFRDYSKAIELNPNNANLQYNLASCYERGDGVKQDYSEAVRLYRAAANQGHTKAQYNLGIIPTTIHSKING